MKKILLTAVIASTTLLASCGVDPNDARRALEAQGITNVQIGGYAVFGCGNRDRFRSKFTGIGVNGKPVSGVVCNSWLRGTTVRYD